MSVWNEKLVEHGFADLSDVRLHYVAAGSGPLVLLLHGFPEFWFSWRHQIAALAASGYRVVAPDMRGFNESGKPQGVAAYHTDVLARDVAELIEHLGFKRGAVVGHDLGGYVGWWAANNHPDQVDRLCVLNAPHPGHAATMSLDIEQMRRSWYMLFFQIPWISEHLTARNNYAHIRRRLTRDVVRRGAFSPADIERYVLAASAPGAATASANYYRALLRTWLSASRKLRPLDLPVRVIWGAHDRYVGLRYATPPPNLVPLCDVQILHRASHWVHNDAPDQVNQLLLEFLSPGGRRWQPETGGN